jgi:hypothetical protein
MANPIALPSDIILAITTIKATSIDPNDFNNAIQELFNRGYGIQGKWIQDHKELYLQALQDGYIAEGTEIPNPEQTKYVVPLAHQSPVNDPEDGPADTAEEPPVVTAEEFPDTLTGVAAPDDGVTPAEEPEGKHRGHK